MVHTPERSDTEILSAIAGGEETAVATLYDRHATLLYGIANQMLRDPGAAEDVVQDVFVSAWRQASSYDSVRGSVTTWLVTLTRNRAIDRIRRERSRNPVGAPVDVETAFDLDSGDDTAGVVLDRMVGNQVREAVADLPDKQRESLELAWFSGFSQSEIATRINVPIGTVKTRMFHGMRQLSELLGQRGIHSRSDIS